MGKTVMEMVADARALVPDISPADADQLRGQPHVLIIDVRDPQEVAQTGKVAGALNVPRGMLEFRADPGSPAYLDAFNHEKTIVLYCGTGGRSALAGKTLLDMGFLNVHNLGSFKQWADAGLPVES